MSGPVYNQRTISYSVRDDYFVQPYVSVYWMDNLIAIADSKQSTVYALDEAMKNDDFILLLTGTMPVKIFLPENRQMFSQQIQHDYPNVHLRGILDLETFARSERLTSEYEKMRRDLQIPEIIQDHRRPQIKVYITRDIATDIYTIFERLNQIAEANKRKESPEELEEREEIFPIGTGTKTVIRRSAPKEPVMYDRRTECFLKILTQINLLLLIHGRSKIDEIIVELEGQGLCSIPYNVDEMIQLMVSESLLYVDRDGYFHL